MTLHLISHDLCPFVQRAVIALTEKGVRFERTNIDLANKPEWFARISPLGKTPVLAVDGGTIFDSAVIVEYLEETQPNPLHPSDPLAKARHRAWMEFGSSVLGDIAGFYSAKDEAGMTAKIVALRDKFARLEDELSVGPFFDGTQFSLVDAVFGPVFRYFDTFDQFADFGILTGYPKVAAWRAALKDRPSVRAAVSANYPVLLQNYVESTGSWLAAIMRGEVSVKDQARVA